MAAVLVASIHLHFLDVLLNLTYQGSNYIAFNVPFRKGQEIGYLHHDSTILVFAADQQSSVSFFSQETLFVWGNRCCKQCSTEQNIADLAFPTLLRTIFRGARGGHPPKKRCKYFPVRRVADGLSHASFQRLESPWLGKAIIYLP